MFLIRSHECKPDGYEIIHNNKVRNKFQKIIFPECVKNCYNLRFIKKKGFKLSQNNNVLIITSLYVTKENENLTPYSASLSSRPSCPLIIKFILSGRNDIFGLQLLRAGLQQRGIFEIGGTSTRHTLCPIHSSHGQNETAHFQTEGGSGRIVGHTGAQRPHHFQQRKVRERI